jgi:hypothetical protein
MHSIDKMQSYRLLKKMVHKVYTWFKKSCELRKPYFVSAEEVQFRCANSQDFSSIKEIKML